MLMKKRTKSITHRILESLNIRLGLSYEEKLTYQNQIKGYEGECLFDKLIDQSGLSGVVINDLLLETKHTYYQMDSIIILNNIVHIYEVKNYTGAYTFKEGALYAESGHSIQHPIDQVNRKKSYLHNLLFNMGYQYPVSAYVAFVNPEFYIYSLPLTKSILFYGHLYEHSKQLSQASKMQTINSQDMKLAEYLVSQHQDDYRPKNIPIYTFNDLKKGIFCPECSSLQFHQTKIYQTCKSCGFRERIADAIYRNILEFQLLFPKMPTTVQHIFTWCGSMYSKFRIRTVLNKEFTQHFKSTETFYT